MASLSIGMSGLVGADTYTYLTDKKSVYVDIEGSDISASGVMAEAAPATFKQAGPGPYIEDAGHVYYQAGVLRGADPATFISFNYHTQDGSVDTGAEGYGKDTMHVYFGSAVIDADSSTFEGIDGIFGKDAHYLYGFGIPLKDVQQSTAVFFGQACPGFGELLKDANHVYQLGYNQNGAVELDLLSSLDAATFDALPDGTFKDKKSTYTTDQICAEN